VGFDYQRNPVYREVKQRLTEVMIRRVEAVLPEVRKHLVWKEASTPLTQERYTLTSEGASYGIEFNTRQFLFRPRARTPIQGLLLAGASMAWGPGIEGAMISGLYAASALLDRDLTREIRAGKVLADPSALPRVSGDWDPLAVARGTRRPRPGSAPGVQVAGSV
jgi:phytoene dehydrogenase-like protein